MQTNRNHQKIVRVKSANWKKDINKPRRTTRIMRGVSKRNRVAGKQRIENRLSNI